MAPAAIDWMIAIASASARVEHAVADGTGDRADRHDRAEAHQHVAERDAARQQRRRDADRLGQVREEHRADERERHDTAAEQREADRDRLGDPVEHHADGEVARSGGVGACGQLGQAHVGRFLDRLLRVFAFGPPVRATW